LLFLALPMVACGQTGQTVGIESNSPSFHALTNATIVTAPGEVIENGTLIIHNGVIQNVGSGISIPEGARVWDMEGKTIYPGFIDAHARVGMQEPREEIDRGDVSWNQQIRSQLKAESEYKSEEDGRDKLRAQGFGAAMSVPTLGIFRGETAVMSLGDGPVADRVIQPGVAQSVSLQRSNEFGFSYPTSQIGTIALIRQTLYDADWYERAQAAYQSNPEGFERPESNSALKALGYAVKGDQPLLFEASSDEEVLRSLRFAEEFTIQPWVRGSGHEYRLLDVLSSAQTPLILPLAFPEKPDVNTPESALNEDLSTLRHWYLAPENAAQVASAGLSFSFTTDGLDDLSHVLPNLRKAVHAGLDRETALAALTINPANLLGISQTHGSIQSGKKANIIIANGDLFETDSRILDVWVEGERHRVESEPAVDIRGTWAVQTQNGSLDGDISIEGTAGQLKGSMTIDGEEIEFSSVSLRDQARRFRADLPGEELGIEGTIRLSASYSGDELNGWAETPGHDRTEWMAEKTAAYEEEVKESPELTPRELQLVNLRPNMEYGREAEPVQPEYVLVRNATIWTMGPEGKLEGADLLVENGKVAQVGQNISAPSGAEIIDADGKHITPGLIDAHLHSGSDGVNEIGGAIVPEVRLGDVLNINNIWMYRQLAGGLTTAHVMHGSANPIGGQNQHVKMRWGALSDGLKFEGAPRTVKFALGENPKRVGTDRYPETRMGTREIIADRFRNARDYEAKWAEWERNGEGIPPRKDLRLEALVDILNEDILIQSHSYRQDEILMLTRLAEEFDFSIKAFHHGVEAYKVAPELAESGVGAVVWSDWSSFKIEAYDATLFNARLLSEAGVLTSLHSDNSQIAARMNWEAAKMVRAGVDPEEALAMVTINTAKILGIDSSVGSLENGKDADFVIWNGDPLSTLTKAEQTWIDGRKYFDLDEDAEKRREVDQERSRLIQLILEDK